MSNVMTFSSMGAEDKPKRVLIEPWAYEIEMIPTEPVQLRVEGSLDIHWNDDCLQIYPANDCTSLDLVKGDVVIETFI